MSIERLMKAIKKTSLGAVNAGTPVNVMVGTVKSVSPLVVVVDQRFELTAEFLVVPESLTRYEVDLKHTHQYQDDTGGGTSPKTTEEALTEKIVIRPGLKAGDRVILLRVQGGQQYIVMDKVVGT